jgi:D-alanine transaminase
MPALANLHGQILPLEQAKISALDRGFLFGDAVYEVLRIYAGKPWLEQEHFTRLERSLEAIRIPGIDIGRLRRRLQETIAAGSFTEALGYIQITRGAAPRRHAFPKDAVPLEFMYVQEFIDSYREARQKGAAVITYPDLRWRRCDIKTTNLLGNVLAMQTAAEANCVEALLFQPDGTMTEASHSSFFVVNQGAVITTPCSPCILPGITRSLLIQLAEKAGVPLREQNLRLEHLHQADEVFLTGTTAEVLPIVKVDDKTIGTGLPGPLTRRLQEVYSERVQEFIRSKK